MATNIDKLPHPPPLEQDAPRPFEPEFSVEYIVAAAYAFASAFLLAILPVPRGQRLVDYVVSAVIIGSVFGHTTSASIWASLGTGRHWVRAFLSLIWLFLLVIGVAILLTVRSDAPPPVVVVIAGTMLVQSVFIQVPLWILRYTIGLKLAIHSEITTDGTERVQFGIGHMMTFTAIIALVLGAGQALVRVLGAEDSFRNDRWSLFLYLAATAILVSLPIAVASLLTRHRVPALLLAMVCLLLVTGLEFPLIQTLGFQSGGIDNWHIVLINLAVALINLAYSLGLRFFGFRLTIGKNPPEPMMNASPF